MENDNIILKTDSYKVGHSVQYPPGTTNVYSYYESRGGLFPATMFFGLQYIIKKHLMDRVNLPDLGEAREIYAAHFGTSELFNYAGWERLIKKHDGMLPIRIKAVPEGTIVPTHNVLMTIENTDPEFYWLTNYLETILSQVWYPTTVATVSYFTRQKIIQYLEKTGTPELIDFKLHDFGYRGVSSEESAAIGGAAHLTNFMGTDTIPALMMLREYYGADMAGFSIPAAEHSTITSWGREHEVDAYRNMIEQYGDYPLYSIVADSFNIYDACEKMFGRTLHNDIVNHNGTMVVRPDSGDDPAGEVVELLNILGRQFGNERNAKGYKVLNPKVRMIWGDGLEPNTIETILHRMEVNQWSADNIAIGMGGGLLQKVNRDTQKFALKCSSVTVNGEERDVFKQPITDPGKSSKRGRLALVSGHHSGTKDGGWLQTISEADLGSDQNLLETVFENGELVKEYTLDDVRRNNGMLSEVSLLG